MMTAYYNDNDPFVAAWLRALISAGHIAPGDVDERSIEDVAPADLDGYVQHHFFAGIGGWSYALRLAGWPDDRPVCTGSCPCQPFSSAGKGEGVDDERHLWPAFRWLIAQRRFPVVFGEQVASAGGRAWLAGVRLDLEGMGYRVGGADLCAAGVGAPHIRQRLFWVADARHDERPAWSEGSQHEPRASISKQFRGARENGGLVHTDGLQCAGKRGTARRRRKGEERIDEPGPLAGGLGDSKWSGRRDVDALRRSQRRTSAGGTDAVSNFWSAFDIVYCDERRFGRGIIARRVEPGTFPLASRVPARVGRLRGYGNPIVPQLAAEFIRAYLNCTHPSNAAVTGE